MKDCFLQVLFNIVFNNNNNIYFSYLQKGGLNFNCLTCKQLNAFLLNEIFAIWGQLYQKRFILIFINRKRLCPIMLENNVY